jgi:hypothetical protein
MRLHRLSPKILIPRPQFGGQFVKSTRSARFSFPNLANHVDTPQIGFEKRTTPPWKKESKPESGDWAIPKSNCWTTRSFTMADQKHNQPSHDSQVKGGQHSQSGSSSNAQNNQGQQKGGQNSQSGSSSNSEKTQGQRNQPSHEASVKGGQHSHSGSGNK